MVTGQTCYINVITTDGCPENYKMCQEITTNRTFRKETLEMVYYLGCGLHCDVDNCMRQSGIFGNRKKIVLFLEQ